MRKIALVLALLLCSTIANAYTLASTGAWTGIGDGTELSPALPGTCPNGSLMTLWAGSRDTGGATLTVTGWTELASNTATAAIKLFGRIKQSGDSAPSVNWSGATWADAQIACWTGNVYLDLSTIVAHTASAGVGGTLNFTYPALTITTANTLVFIMGKKNKSVVGDGLTVDAESGFTEIGESVSTANTGNTQISVWNYVLQTTAANITSSDWAASGAGVYESTTYTTMTVSLKTSTGMMLRRHR